MSYPSTILQCLAILFLAFLFSTFEANNNGFNVKLIRKNFTRVSYNQNIAQSPIIIDRIGYQYLMELSIGSPPVTSYAIIDTGSDLMWFQCVPCTNCYKQLNPMFNPKNSSTYTNIGCESEWCGKLEIGVTSCSSDQTNCNYKYSYVDQAVTQGVLAKETIKLTSTTREPVSLEGIVFGCGHNNNGSFSNQEMGIIGLGMGSTSLISQIGSSLGGNMFSQCLVPFNTDPRITSHMSFGKGSEVVGSDVVSIPLVTNDAFKTLYFVTLLGISVEDTNLPFNNDPSLGPTAKANMMIDSGTQGIMLPEQFYHRLMEEVRNKVTLEPILDSASTTGYQLCYQTKTNLNGPMLTAHFEGADVILTPTQLFIQVHAGVFCFAATSSLSNEFGIYGNYAQSNYLIGFDLDRQVVSFKPTDCTKLKQQQGQQISSASSRSLKAHNSNYPIGIFFLVLATVLFLH